MGLLRELIRVYEFSFNERKYWKRRYFIQNNQKKNSLKLFYFSAWCRRVESKKNSQSGIGVSGDCCVFGNGVSLPHGWANIIIPRNCVIGNNVAIFQNVTIAEENKELTTIIEDDVVIGAGAVILNNVRIGKGAKVGANAVVTKDVEPGTVVAGVPAVVIRRG